jgi:hypothetical protein
VNIDDKQFSASDKFTSVLRSPLQTFSVPARLGITNKKWPAERDQIDAEKAEANRALFDGRAHYFGPRAGRG